MIEIDGSFGEGGGQILRTSVALSALTMQPIHINKIRAGRPNPGLRRQHIAGIELVGRLVNASISGLEVGSSEITFKPTERRGGNFRYDIGTAGSISLVLQAVLPAAALSPEPIRLELKGGTDVAWSPPVDYMREVFAHALKRMGLIVDIVQKRRGHYPRGGGEVLCSVNPIEKISPTRIFDFGVLKKVDGISHCARLPPHVAMRQTEAAESTLSANRIGPVNIKTETYPKKQDPHIGPGSGIVLWAESDDGIRIGSDSLGKKGKPAEEVGHEAANQLIKEIQTDRAVDSHLCDMLVPYLAIASGESRIGITHVTSHLRTNIWVARKILGVDIALEGQLDQCGILTAVGIGLTAGQG